MKYEIRKKTVEDVLAGIADQEFFKWLETSGFYEKPAGEKHHGAYEGGLVDHSIQVASELITLTKKLNLSWRRLESPAVVGVLHDICKIDDYKIEKNKNADGRSSNVITYNQQKAWPGHGEKSLIILMGRIELTEEEKICIRYHMGAFTDQKEWEFYSRAMRKYPNVLYTHTADMIASQIKGI